MVATHAAVCSVFLWVTLPTLSTANLRPALSGSVHLQLTPPFICRKGPGTWQSESLLLPPFGWRDEVSLVRASSRVWCWGEGTLKSLSSWRQRETSYCKSARALGQALCFYVCYFIQSPQRLQKQVHLSPLADAETGWLSEVKQLAQGHWSGSADFKACVPVHASAIAQKQHLVLRETLLDLEESFRDLCHLLEQPVSLFPCLPAH